MCPIPWVVGSTVVAAEGEYIVIREADHVKHWAWAAIFLSSVLVLSRLGAALSLLE